MPELLLQRPGWLLLGLLSALVVIVALWRGRRSDLVRAAVLGLLALGLARPQLAFHTEEVHRVYLLDHSASIPPGETDRALAVIAERHRAAHAEGPATLLLFADGAAALPLPDAPVDDDVLAAQVAEVTPGREGSDLAAGLSLAGALIPPGAAARLLVAHDGHPTSPEPELDSAQNTIEGTFFAISALLLDPLPPGPRLAGVELPPHPLSPGATLRLKVEVHGGQTGLSEGAGGLRLELLGDASEEPQLLEERPLTMDPGGTTTVALETSLPEELPPGLARLRLVVGQDELLAGVMLRHPPVAWLVGPDRELRHLGEVLAAERFEVLRRDPAALAGLDADAVEEALADVDLVVLGGSPTARRPDRPAPLPAAFVQALDPWVRGGGGLLTLGGEFAYDQGDWDLSPLAELLPVTMDPTGEEEVANLTLVIALDRSGSMAQPVATLGGGSLAGALGARMRGGTPEGSRIQLVNRAAIAAVERLRPEDRVGVLAVDTHPDWVVPVQSAAARVSVVERILGIGAGGGGIYVFAALEAAVQPLADSDTRLRHLILFADTADAVQQQHPETGQQAEDFVAEKAEELEFTLSVIGVGPADGRDADFLRELARSGGGRFLRADSHRQLRALFMEETERALGRGLDEDESFAAVLEGWHPALQGLRIERAPRLAGRNKLEARPRSRRILVTSDGAPLLSSWRLGNGQVVSWASDAGPRWAAGWLRWPGYARFWTQLARSLVRDMGASGGPELEVRGERLLLTSRGPDGLSTALPNSTLQAVVGDSEPTTLDLELVAPGQRQTTLELSEGVPWRVALTTPGGEVLASAEGLGPPSPERRATAPDPSTLETIALLEGRPSPDSGPRRAVELWPWLLALALLLLPVEVAIARRSPA